MLNELEKIWEERIIPQQYTFTGLVAMNLFSIVCILLGIHFLHSETEIFNQFNDLKLTISVCIFVALIITLRWFWIRRFPKFGQKEIGILFAPILSDLTVDKEISLLKESVDFFIKSEFGDLNIKVFRLSPHRAPINAEKAHELRKSSHAALIIWGRVITGNHQSRRHSAFQPINFSYNIQLPPEKTKNINQKLTELIKTKRWILDHSNSLFERDYLAQNIEEVSFIAISISLFFAKRFSIALKSLEVLFKKYSERNVLSSEETNVFKNIKTMIHVIHDLQCNNLSLLPKDQNDISKIVLALEHVTTMKKYKENSYHLLEAQILQIQNKTDEAIKVIRSCPAYLNPVDATTHYSLAYLYFYKGDFKKAFEELRKIKATKRKQPTFQIPNILSWYFQTLEQEPQKKQMNFPIGYIYFHEVGDHKIAAEHLNIFVSHYSKAPEKELQILITQASKLIQKISSNFNSQN